MTDQPLSEIVGIRGAWQVLDYLASESEAATIDRATEVCSTAEANDPSFVIDVLIDRGIVAQLDSRLLLSSLGARIYLLLQALNGRHLREVLPLLREQTPTLGYEIVRQGMTARFIRDLHRHPDFRRVYICSPWISFEPITLRYFADAISHAESRGSPVDILVITRPDKSTRGVPEAAKQLASLGAEIVLKPKLHSKLYIREPTLRGGLVAAIFGSENLTRSKYLELGIYIRNDSQLIQQLIRYFFDVYSSGETP